MTPDDIKPKTLKFRCPAGLEDKLPTPKPAALGLPGWLKTMPTQAFNAINMRDEDTVKRCPPFIDAMTNGFLIPLICDLRIEKGSITWDNDLPPGGDLDFPRSPVGFHNASQVGLAAVRARPLRDQVSQSVEHRSARGLFAIVHAPDQSLRPAVHHADRAGRLRPLPR